MDLFWNDPIVRPRFRKFNSKYKESIKIARLRYWLRASVESLYRAAKISGAQF
jgi:hypothetical protein